MNISIADSFKDLPSDCIFVACQSADNFPREYYNAFEMVYDNNNGYGDCYSPAYNLYYLIIKKRFFHTPTIQSYRTALSQLATTYRYGYESKDIVLVRDDCFSLEEVIDVVTSLFKDMNVNVYIQEKGMRIRIKGQEDANWLAKEAMTFKQRVELKQSGYTVNAKSILGIMSLNFALPMELTIVTIEDDVKEDFQRRMRRLVDCGE